VASFRIIHSPPAAGLRTRALEPTSSTTGAWERACPRWSRRDCTRSRQAPYYQLWCGVRPRCRPPGRL